MKTIGIRHFLPDINIWASVLMMGLFKISISAIKHIKYNMKHISFQNMYVKITSKLY